MTTDARPANADLAAIKDRLSTTTPPPWHRTDTPTPADVAFALAAREVVPALIHRIEELRAVLEPLLDDPMHGEPSSCVFCHASEYELGGSPDYSFRRAESVEHNPECPTRHADRLLGRK